MMLLVLFGITGVGSLMLLASSMRVPESATDVARPATATPNTSAKAVEAPAAAVGGAVATAPVTAEPALEPTDRVSKPRWTAAANSRKAGYGANIVFELTADQDIEVWRKRVRPVLTMRCAGRTTEVFIVTQAPATIEDRTNRHSVKIGFDGQEPVEQMWEHSIDHDALFAINGPAMMRQIVSTAPFYPSIRLLLQSQPGTHVSKRTLFEEAEDEGISVRWPQFEQYVIQEQGDMRPVGLILKILQLHGGFLPTLPAVLPPEQIRSDKAGMLMKPTGNRTAARQLGRIPSQVDEHKLAHLFRQRRAAAAAPERDAIDQV
jgi:hypothetical protein